MTFRPQRLQRYINTRWLFPIRRWYTDTSQGLITPEDARKAAAAEAASISTQTAAAASAIAAAVGEAKSEAVLNDPELIFKKVWTYLEETYGRENLAFPKEIIFLMGAPGSGKGTNSPFILRLRVRRVFSSS